MQFHRYQLTYIYFRHWDGGPDFDILVGDGFCNIRAATDQELSICVHSSKGLFAFLVSLNGVNV